MTAIGKKKGDMVVANGELCFQKFILFRSIPNLLSTAQVYFLLQDHLIVNVV